MEHNEKNSRAVFLIASAVLFLGAVLGFLAKDDQTQSLKMLLTEGELGTGRVVFFRYFLLNMIFLCFCWGWSFMPITAPLAIMSVGIKAYLTTLTAAALTSQYVARGFWLYFAIILPHNALWVFVLLHACLASSRMYAHQKKDGIQTKERIRHVLRLILYIAVLCVCCAWEAKVAGSVLVSARSL